MQLTQIGVIRSPFKEATGMPIQPALAKDIEGAVDVFPQYAPALKDLDGFERIWLIYWFDKAASFRPTVVPYLDTAERGLFATRAPARPNPIGISSVRLLSIDDAAIRVAELDVLDGTPLLDIKPYVPRFDSYPEACSGWVDAVRIDHNGNADGRFFRNKGDT